MKINFDPSRIKEAAPKIKEKMHNVASKISEKVKITPEQAAAYKANLAKLPANLKEKLNSLLKK